MSAKNKTNLSYTCLFPVKGSYTFIYEKKPNPFLIWRKNMLQWGLILKNQNPTLSLVYGVFTVIETLEAFLPYGLCSAFVNLFRIVQLWVMCQSVLVSEMSNSRCTAIVVRLELAGFPSFRLHECTEIRFLEHSAVAGSLREISRDNQFWKSHNRGSEILRNWSSNKKYLGFWVLGYVLVLFLWSQLIWNCLCWELLEMIYHYFLSNTGMCQLC